MFHCHSYVYLEKIMVTTRELVHVIREPRGCTTGTTATAWRSVAGGSAQRSAATRRMCVVWETRWEDAGEKTMVKGMKIEHPR